MRRISGRPKAVNGLGWALLDPIQWLPHVQAEERENHPHQVVKPYMKGPPETNHCCWIWISQINNGDAKLVYKQTQ